MLKTLLTVTVGAVVLGTVGLVASSDQLEDLDQGIINFQCRCGKVQGTARVGIHQMRMVCHCSDCRKWGLLPIAGGGATLTDQGKGGSDMVLVYKGALSLKEGSHDHIAVKRLYEDSKPLRYTATCCDTSIGVAMPQPFCIFGLSVSDKSPVDPEGILTAPRIHIRMSPEVASKVTSPDIPDTKWITFINYYLPMAWRGSLYLRVSPFPESQSADQVVFPGQRVQ